MSEAAVRRTDATALETLVNNIKASHAVDGRVCPDRLARQLEAELVVLPPPEVIGDAVKGQTVRHYGTLSIGLSPALTPEDRTLTLFHEIGHVFKLGDEVGAAESFAAEMVWDERGVALGRAMHGVNAGGNAAVAFCELARAWGRRLELRPHLIDETKKNELDAQFVGVAVCAAGTAFVYGVIALVRLFRGS